MGEMPPPWLNDPNLGSGNWSPPYDADFAKYREWLQSLDDSSLAEYEKRYPPPPNWTAFYLVFARKIPPYEEGRHVDSEGKTLPPWLVFPAIPAGSIGWRMGGGEDYYDEFYRYYSRLSDEEAAEFARKYPESDGWQGKYAQIRAHRWK